MPHGFHEIGHHAGLSGGVDALFIVIRGKEHDRQGAGLAYFDCGLDAVFYRHLIVHDDKLRQPRRADFHGISTVRACCNDIKASLLRHCLEDFKLGIIVVNYGYVPHAIG